MRQRTAEFALESYPGLLKEIKARIRAAQYEALKAVNRELVGLYWDIGRMIVERQIGQGWGKGVVEQLAADLRREFPAVGGSSASNLWRMKAFYEAYRGLEKLAPLVREIGWSHNLATGANSEMENSNRWLEKRGEQELERARIGRGQDFPSARLTGRYGKGFSRQALWSFRQFYVVYSPKRIPRRCPGLVWSAPLGLEGQ